MARLGMQVALGTSAFLQELEQIWTEIGESEKEKDHMLVELEKECMQVYRRKVDEARSARARLHQSLVSKEAEVASLMALLGEQHLQLEVEKATSLKGKLASVNPILENLQKKKEDRVKQFSDIWSQIEKLNVEITGFRDAVTIEEHDLSIRKLTEYQTKLRSLQKEKSDRLHNILEHVNEVHSLCGALGVDFRKIVGEVHPSLHETCGEKSTNISDTTLEGLSQAILKLRTEKKIRVQRLQDATASLLELWNLMDSSEEERRPFEKVTIKFRSPENDVMCPGVLSLEIIKQTEAEVKRLKQLKVSRMKELVLRKRLELEEICRYAHIEPDTSTAPEKTCALLDSCLVDPSELMTNIETQIEKAKEQSMTRKEIIDRVNKWLFACEEENWLEDYNKDWNRYSAGRGGHLNLKRAEKARVIVGKIPAIVDNLMSKIFIWEDERNVPFLYDGVHLVSILEEYKINRQQKEEEKRRYREHKKLRNLLLTEKEAAYGSKSTLKPSNSFDRKTNMYLTNGYGNGFMTPIRRISAGDATPELLTPRSHSGRYNSYFKEARRLSAVSVSKEDAVSLFASVAGSGPGSPHT
ncbi:unnamed protein product [Musa acuminata subsp. burmannicoides]